MKNLWKWIATLLVVALITGCASGPKYAEVGASISEPGSGKGRIYLYRTAILGAAVQPDIKVNGEVIGSAVPKGFLYLDREPGKYQIVTSTEVDRHLSLTLEAGQTRYVRLNISMGFFVGHVYPELVENAVGAEEIQQCSYIGQ